METWPIHSKIIKKIKIWKIFWIYYPYLLVKITILMYISITRPCTLCFYPHDSMSVWTVFQMNWTDSLIASKALSLWQLFWITVVVYIVNNIPLLNLHIIIYWKCIITGNLPLQIDIIWLNYPGYIYAWYQK